MLSLLASIIPGLGKTDSNWVPTHEVAERELRSVVAADGKRYAEVVPAVKQVNFSDGSIRFLPEEGATAQLVVTEA